MTAAGVATGTAARPAFLRTMLIVLMVGSAGVLVVRQWRFLATGVQVTSIVSAVTATRGRGHDTD